MTGEVTAVARLANEAVELAEDLGNRRVLVSGLRLRGEGLMRQSRFAKASADLDRAQAVARDLAAPAEVAGVTCSQACLALEQQRLTEAQGLAEAALEQTSLPHTLRATFPQWVLGVVALTYGDLRAAEQMFRSGITPLSPSPLQDKELEHADAMPRHWANGMWGLARVRLAAGSIPEAAHLHRLALERRHTVGDRLGVVESLVASAAVVAASDPGTASHLVAAAADVRASLGAVATPRQTADVAVIPAALAAKGEEQPRRAPVDEAAAVHMASRALGNLQQGRHVPQTQPRGMQAQAGTRGG
jgi:hypothetical protein